MEYIQVIILGVVQALTEFLPISSSAHLIVFRDWLRFQTSDDLTFDVALHIGTVLALIMYFHRDLTRMVVGFVGSLRHPRRVKSFEQRLPWYILASMVPAVLVGGTLQQVIEDRLRNSYVIVITLFLGGILFLLAEKYTKRTEGMEAMTLKKSLLIGLAQSLALIPGVSRSGITIITGMTQHLTRAEAARFSFLMSVPIMLAAGFKEALDLRDIEMAGPEVRTLILGALTSALIGWLVIRFLLRFLGRHTLNVFAYYRFALAAAVLGWLIL
jgi:undecaprenyl-diphosphatase